MSEVEISEDCARYPLVDFHRLAQRYGVALSFAKSPSTHRSAHRRALFGFATGQSRDIYVGSHSPREESLDSRLRTRRYASFTRVFARGSTFTQLDRNVDVIHRAGREKSRDPALQ